MKRETSLIHSLCKAAESKDHGITFIDGTGNRTFMSYEDLKNRSTHALLQLQSKGICEGDEVIVQVEDNLHFLITFWGCVLGGFVPIPVSFGNAVDHRLKIINIWNTLSNPHLVIDKKNRARLKDFIESNQMVTNDNLVEDSTDIQDIVSGSESDVSFKILDKDHIAYIQYSSGSTGNPKGVILTHKNLLTNIYDIIDRSEITSRDAMLSWMPLTHDMGLIGVHLTGIVAGINQCIITTSVFIRNPLIWMSAASEYKVTLLYSPNFGLQYFLNSFLNKGLNASYSLSSVRILYNGAEIISEELCNEFYNALSYHGLKRNIIRPVYGLAEASVAVTIPDAESGIIKYRLDREKLNIGDTVEELNQSSGDNGATFVEVGYPIAHTSLRIVNDEGVILDQEKVGHIQIKGDNVTNGYYNNNEATQDLYTNDHWLRTGDLGFLKNGRLVVIGRHKNIIILNGQNFYPQDIENTLIQEGIVEPGKVVACGVRFEHSVSDKLVVFILSKGKKDDFSVLKEKCSNAIASSFGFTPDDVVALRKFPKTTSGKIQNFKMVDDYLESKQVDQRTGKKEQNLDDIILTLRHAFLNFFHVEPTQDEDLISLTPHSLQLVRFVNHIEIEFGISFSVDDIFNHSTLFKLASCIKERYNKQSQATAILKREIRTLPTSDYYDVADNQTTLLSINDHYADYINRFNISVAYLNEKPLDYNALNKALNKCMSSHESLRTVFTTSGENYQQKIQSIEDCMDQLTTVDLAKIKGDLSIQEIIDEEANKKFDIGLGPLLRATIFRLKGGKSIFCVTIHHLISDGWSMYVLMNQLKREYDSLLLGKSTTVPGLGFHYKDYASWLNHELTQEYARENQAYWLDRLQTSSCPKLPIENILNVPKRFDAAIHVVKIPKDAQEKLTKIGVENSATLFMGLVSVVKLLIFKYTNQSDITIGTDLASRVNPKLEQHIGHYINTIPLRTAFNTEDTFTQLIQQVRHEVLNAFAHQLYSYDELVNKLSKKRQSDLFDTLVLFQDFEQVQGMSMEFYGDLLRPKIKTSLVNLQFEFVRSQKDLSLNLTYNIQLFNPDVIQTLADHFITLLNAVITEPSDNISNYNMVSVAERHRLLEEFNSKKEQQSTYISIPDLLESGIESYRDKTAIVYKENGITYGQLSDRSNQLANYLIEENIACPEEKIGILMYPSEHTITALLGVLKSGAVYVPIDPNYPKERVALLIQECAINTILTDKKCFDQFNLTIDESMVVDEFFPCNLSTATPEVSHLSDQSLAYIMFTSGSTGIPKGVMVQHGAVVDYCQGFVDYFGLTMEDRVIQQSSLSFDTSIEEIFPILSVYGKLIIAEHGGKNVDELLFTIEDTKATILSTTPLVINELNEYPDLCSSLRCLISGGDELKPHYITNLFGKTRIFNTYGPTESTVCALYHEIPKVEETGIIGSPIRNRGVYILNEQSEILPVGLVGEIYISGKGLAKGYLNNELETRRRFLPHPYLKDEKIYKTGDLGRWLPDGRIAFMGRSDFQVKVNGYRIEVEEVEETLSRYADIKNVIVSVAKEQETQFLVAFYVADHDLEESNIRLFAQRNLPEFMVPSLYQRVEKLEQSVNGKVDRKLMIRLLKNTSQTLVPAEGKLQATLLEIWVEVLKVDQIGVNHNFFALGGNSIKAVKIITRIGEKLKMKIQLEDLFLHPTIAEMSDFLSDVDEQLTQGIDEAPDLEYYPMSPYQQGLWMIEQLYKSGAPNNLSATGIFNGKLNRHLFEEAIQLLIERHESLRTVIVNIDGEPKQVIKDNGNFSLDFIELFNEHNFEQAEWLIKSDVLSPFDLSEGPLFRIKLMQLDEYTFIVVIVIHHIISDATSLSVLTREVFDTYNHLLRNKEGGLKPLTIQFKDYAWWQNNQLANNEYRESMCQYWQEQLEGIKRLKLPLDYERPSNMSFEGGEVLVSLNKYVPRLKKFVRKYDITWFSLLMSTLEVVFYQYGNEEVAVGTTVSLRDHYNLEDQIGYYINTIVLKQKIKHEYNFLDLSSANQNLIAEAHAHSMYPFNSIVDDLKVERQLNRNPLVDVMVNFHEGEIVKGDFNTVLKVNDELTFRQYKAFQASNIFDLNIDFNLGSSAKSLSMNIGYLQNLFDQETIELFGERYTKTLDLLLAHSDRSIEKLDFRLSFESDREATLKSSSNLQEAF